MRSSEGGPLGVSLLSLGVEIVVVEAREGWGDAVSLSHVEVLSEVLVSAPPVGVDHGDLLIFPNLMEVRISNVVLLSISWESSILVIGVVISVGLTNVPFPVGDHTLLLLLGEEIENERLVEVEDQQDPENSDSILIGQVGDLPEGVAEWVLEESGNVFEGSPFLGHISSLLGLSNHFAEITVCFFGECSERQKQLKFRNQMQQKYIDLPSNHVSSLHHVWVAVEESLDTGQSLSEIRFWVFAIV